MIDTFMALIKKEIKNTEKTGNYDNLSKFAYSNNFDIRFLFMSLLISSTSLDLYDLYEDDISHYFVTYDNDGNITSTMPYEYVKVLADKILRKRNDLDSYQKIINFIINNYFPSPEEFRQSMVK